MSDRERMLRCIALAARAEGRTSPNPLVGSVIVDRQGQIIGEGYHKAAGRPHAEVAALRAAKASVRGATMYVSLEPCNHHGKTPPCVGAIVEAGISEVVYGAGDPIAGHGGGARSLRRRGVRVRGGVLADDVREQNRGFFSVVQAGRPFITVKAAMTLDGKIATSTGESRWITGEQARRAGHELRNRLDAIVVGVGTALADDPQLTARGGRGFRDPIRVVVDSRLRTPPTAKLLPGQSASKARCIIATTNAATTSRQRRLESEGAEIWRLPSRQGHVSLRRLVAKMASSGMATAYVEGGGTLVGALLAQDLADEIRLHIAPMALGGDAPSWVGGPGVKRLDKSHKFRYFGEPKRLGDDLEVVLRRR